MFGFELETLPPIVEQRQVYLRSLAGHGPYEVEPESFRQHAGRVLVRFGRWVEGRRSDDAATILPPLSSSTPRLVGGAK
jgi:hypothetical protein